VLKMEARPFSFFFKQRNRKIKWAGTMVMLFLVRNSQVKKKCEIVHCHDAL
jgi:hypothetical protein